MNCKYTDSVVMCYHCKIYISGDPTSEVVVMGTCRTCDTVLNDNTMNLMEPKPNKVNYERMWLDNEDHHES